MVTNATLSKEHLALVSTPRPCNMRPDYNSDLVVFSVGALVGRIRRNRQLERRKVRTRWLRGKGLPPR